MTTNQTLIRNLSYPVIDGIRFYAAFIVFVEHILGSIVIEYFKVPADNFGYTSSSSVISFLFYLADGNHGVDIFFIISGFLMARVIAKDGLSYQSFIAARIKRIYPAFLACLVITTAIVIGVFGWPWMPRDFAYNLIFLNAFPEFGVKGYNHVTWSLGYEFLFYLIIPILALFSRAIPTWVAGVVLMIAAAFLIPDSLIRINALFAGALIGTLSDRTLKGIAARIPITVVLAAFVGCGLLKYVFHVRFLTYYWTLIPCVSLLFIRLVWAPSMLGNILATPVFRKLGTLSYSVYLYHSVIGSLVLYKLTPWPASIGGAIFCFVTTLVITLIVSYLSYQIFENWYFKKPNRKIGIGAAKADT